MTSFVPLPLEMSKRGLQKKHAVFYIIICKNYNVMIVSPMMRAEIIQIEFRARSIVLIWGAEHTEINYAYRDILKA